MEEPTIVQASLGTNIDPITDATATASDDFGGSAQGPSNEPQIEAGTGEGS